jgi:hypothetical protein
MDIGKIKELIAELEQDIEVKSEALQGLQRLLSSANGHKIVNAEGQMAQRESVSVVLSNPTDSYVDLAVKIIEANDGRPMPMMQIVERIRSIKRNPAIERRSVEATLYQHTKAKGDSSRIIKVSPGVYGVRRFTREVAYANVQI